jgi:uncharacterized protein (TIGR03437 family)
LPVLVKRRFHMKSWSRLWLMFLLLAAPLSAANVPAINAGGILNGAGFSLVSKSLAPGSIAAIFGSNLSDGTVCVPPNCGPGFDANGKVIPKMAGASVTFNGIAAPILSTPNATQLNVQVPVELAGAASATVVVTVAGQSSAPSTVSLAPLAPGLISLNASGSGQGAVLNDKDANKGIQSLVESPANAPNAHLALAGDVIEIYGTGLGAMTPPVATGMRPTGLPQTVTTPIVTIGGIPAQINFPGLAGCCVGLNQINVTVPQGVAPGNAVLLVLSIGGQISNTVTIGIGSSSGGGGVPVVLQGTATSLSGTLPGANILGSTATGNAPLNLTGLSNSTQTVYSGSSNGNGTVQCAGTTSNYTFSLSVAITVAPPVPSLATSGGSLGGSYSYSGSANVCNNPETLSGNGTVSGSVSPGGATTLTLTPSGSGGTKGVVLTGTAQAISATVPGARLDPSATGNVTVTATGVSSAGQTALAASGQTVYTATGSGSGTVSCAAITGSNTTSSWSVTGSGTAIVTPDITSLSATGGSVTGTWNASGTVTGCGLTKTLTTGGTVSGIVSPGGAVTLTFN